jgi:hypothetical protein
MASSTSRTMTMPATLELFRLRRLIGPWPAARLGQLRKTLGMVGDR